MIDRAYEISIDEGALRGLSTRLEVVRLPVSLDADGWEDGTSLSFMRRLVDHWRHRFDWRAQEERLNRLPNRMMILDGQDVHFVHQPGTGPAPMPLVLTHGWPGSFIEFERLIPLLADPSAHGGDPADAFHVVVPSLPGYGFSPAPTRQGVGPREMQLPPRSWVERAFDLQRWTSMPVGGHFAALEQPRLLAEDIRAFFRPIRTVQGS